MNDNIPATSLHHMACLDLLSDMHGLFDWADKMQIEIHRGDPSAAYALQFSFWRDEMAKVLGVDYKKSGRCSSKKFLMPRSEFCAPAAANQG